MILSLGGKSRREARRLIERAASALVRKPSAITWRAQKIERERVRAKVAGTRELATALEIALSSTRRDVLHRLQHRLDLSEPLVDPTAQRLADGIGQLGWDSRHLERAFAPTVRKLYLSGHESAKAELRALPMREAEPRKAYTVNTAFEDFDPTAAIEALLQTEFVFSRQVVDRERDALKRLIQDAIAHGDTGEELQDAIRLFFEDGIHYVGDGGALVRVMPEDAWINQVARTEVARAQNAGIVDTFKAANVDMVQYIATEDEKVCDDCLDLDGQVFPITDADNIPPIHPSCRCTVVAADDFTGPN